MSRQDEARERQGYTPKFIPPTCGNCAHRKFDLKDVERGRWEAGRIVYFMAKEPTKHRCGIGGFAVKLLGSCAEHSPAPEEGGAA